jgi:hypothetical protein
MKRLISIVSILLLALGAATAEQKKLAKIEFVVVRSYNGKPVRNASVVMHPVAKNGKQENGGIQLKTDSEGKASFDGVPYGKLRIQAIAQGLQTYGEDFDISEPVHQITIKLNRPAEQYSIYK